MFNITQKISEGLKPVIKRIDEVRHSLTLRVNENEKKGNDNEQQLIKLTAIIKKLLADNQKLRNDVDTLLDLKTRKESDEPWIDFTGGDIDPDKGLQLQLDWNDAFIDQLRSQGYRGITETELVGQYILELSNMIAEKERQSNSEDA